MRQLIPRPLLENPLQSTIEHRNQLIVILFFKPVEHMSDQKMKVKFKLQSPQFFV